MQAWARKRSHTLNAADEAVMKIVQLQLAGTDSLSEGLLAALSAGQADIAPYLHKPLLQPPLCLIHTCVGRLKLILQSISIIIITTKPHEHNDDNENKNDDENTFQLMVR